MKSATVDIPALLGLWSTGGGPLYRRLANGIERLIRQGYLPTGALLPPERSLAEQLAVSRSTVIAAYDLLRSDGLLESRRGSGTRVAAPEVDVRGGSGVGEIRQTQLGSVLGRPSPTEEIVDLTIAAPVSLPGLSVDEFLLRPEEVAPLLAHHGYLPLGLPALRQAIAERYSSHGLRTSVDQILITNGAQQAISILASAFCRSGESVVVENPTYFGALDVFRSVGARLVGVPLDAHGVDVDILWERVEAARPRLIYLMPDFHNPTGTVVPESRRRAIAELAANSGTPLMEDLSLGDINFDSPPPPPIASYASAGTVFTAGSLSKLCWPGLRVGWLRGPVEVIAELGRTKAVADLGSPILSQAIAARLVPMIDQLALLRREEVLEKLDFAADFLARELPDWTSSRPAGGLYLWLRLPRGDSRALAQRALRYGVRIIPGAAMSLDDSQDACLRLPLIAEIDVLALGLQRLKQAWQATNETAAFASTDVGVLV